MSLIGTRMKFDLYENNENEWFKDRTVMISRSKRMVGSIRSSKRRAQVGI